MQKLWMKVSRKTTNKIYRASNKHKIKCIAGKTNTLSCLLYKKEKLLSPEMMSWKNTLTSKYYFFALSVNIIILLLN